MTERRFTLHSIRTSKQGQQINVGKHNKEYEAIVNVLTMHPEDMKALNILPGGSVRLRSSVGEAIFLCQAGKVPEGMIFVPYGPPTCRLYDGETDGTGMPTTKGWEVEVEPIPTDRAVRRTGRGREATRFANRREAMGAAQSPGESGALERGPHFAEEPGLEQSQAWEEIESGRYMPRRIRGSNRGRALG